MGGLCQAAFGRPDAVLAYLSRYTHRITIANSRLVALRGLIGEKLQPPRLVRGGQPFQKQAPEKQDFRLGAAVGAIAFSKRHTDGRTVQVPSAGIVIRAAPDLPETTAQQGDDFLLNLRIVQKAQKRLFEGLVLLGLLDLVFSLVRSSTAR
jgi:hypothetical protein